MLNMKVLLPDMKWTMNSDDSVTFENTVMLDGESTSNIAQIKRVY